MFLELLADVMNADFEYSSWRYDHFTSHLVRADYCKTGFDMLK